MRSFLHAACCYREKGIPPTASSSLLSAAGDHRRCLFNLHSSCRLVSNLLPSLFRCVMLLGNHLKCYYPSRGCYVMCMHVPARFSSSRFLRPAATKKETPPGNIILAHSCGYCREKPPTGGLFCRFFCVPATATPSVPTSSPSPPAPFPTTVPWIPTAGCRGLLLAAENSDRRRDHLPRLFFFTGNLSYLFLGCYNRDSRV